MKYFFKTSTLWILSIFFLFTSCNTGEDNYGIKKSDCGDVEFYETVGYEVAEDFMDDPTFDNCNQYVGFTRALIRICRSTAPEEYQANFDAADEFLDGFSCETEDDLDDLEDFLESLMPS